MEEKSWRRIDAWRKAESEAKIDSMLESIGTEEQRKFFIQDLKNLFYNESANAYHYFVPEAYDEAFLITVEDLKLILSKFSCRCRTKKERPHRHYILWIPNPNNSKTPAARVSIKMNRVMKSMGIKRNKQDRRCIYGKRIKSRSHLVNTVLYIQTVKTKGRHGGGVVDCNHNDQGCRVVVIPNRKCLYVFRRQEVDMDISEYKNERNEEWLKHRHIKEEKKSITMTREERYERMKDLIK
jgi:hypothetical protein